MPPRSISGSPTVAISQSSTPTGRVGSSAVEHQVVEAEVVVDQAARRRRRAGARRARPSPSRSRRCPRCARCGTASTSRRSGARRTPSPLFIEASGVASTSTRCRSISTSSALVHSARVCSSSSVDARREVAARDDPVDALHHVELRADHRLVLAERHHLGHQREDVARGRPGCGTRGPCRGRPWPSGRSAGAAGSGRACRRAASRSGWRRRRRTAAPRRRSASSVPCSASQARTASTSKRSSSRTPGWPRRSRRCPRSCVTASSGPSR